PPGTWIVVAGGWHESQFTEKRKPKPEDLDALSSDHPIWVQYLYTEATMNKAAIKAVGLTAQTKDPFAGKIVPDASGQPTAVVTRSGGITAFYFKLPRPPPAAQIASTRSWFRELNRLALTDVGDVAGGGLIWPGDYQAASTLHERGELTVRLHWYMQPNPPGGELEVIKRFVTPTRPGSGDDWLRPIGVGEQGLASSYGGDR